MKWLRPLALGTVSEEFALKGNVGKIGGRDLGLEQLLTNRQAAGEGVACRRVGQGHALERQLNALGALGPQWGS